MAKDVSYASGNSTLESLILHCLPDYGEHGDGILNTNNLTATLREKGAYELVTGGLEAWYGVLKAENTNGQWQDKDADMKANSQDPNSRLRWDWKVYTNSIVLNALDKARNQGRAAIKQYLTTLREQATETNENKFNSAFWKATPGANDPDSVPSIISATPTTGTIGGLSRVTETYLRNGVYTTAISDIGAEAGIAAMVRLAAQYAVGKSMTDIIVMPEDKWAGLAGYLTTLLRFRTNDNLLKLNTKAIEIGDMLVIYENSVVLGGANTISNTVGGSGYMYGINSKMGLKVKQLASPDMGQNGWATEFERVGRSMNKALYYNWFGNLVSRCPRSNWVATAVSTT